MPYDHISLEKKWQKYWSDNQTYKTENPPFDTPKPKKYILDMFPYPSGAGLHVGHPKGYTATDIMSRYYHALGYNVLHPMGFDAFGLPAENYAVKTGTHPRITTEANIATFTEQLKNLGFSYDWDRVVDTTDPKYYQWTQWIFLELFKKWLAYEAEMPVNWCPALKAVLANEEVVDGKSEIGGHPVEKKRLRQWVLRITEYADRLIEDLDGLDWPEGIKEMQRNWIGKSEGCEFEMRKSDAPSKSICVYTTRIDTVYGMTYAVLAPDHPKVWEFITDEYRTICDRYIAEAKWKSDQDRTNEWKEKTGVWTGSYVVNPYNGESVPLWIADYVLGSYGTGAVMAVPAHDERDWEFAKKYVLPIKNVVINRWLPDWTPILTEGDKPFINDWMVIETWIEWTFLMSPEARQAFAEKAEKEWFGVKKVNYKLRDWLFSRQRYWGEPIPLIHISHDDYGNLPTEKGSGAYIETRSDAEYLMIDGVEYSQIYDGLTGKLVIDSSLPLLLPEVERYEPSGDGQSPLATVPSFVNIRLASNLIWKRETNTMPQWWGSCWYYLRYMDTKNPDALASREAMDYWSMVDEYVGGAEHAVLHLLYARFWHKVLYDIGVVPTPEPFQKLTNVGLILGPDGQKMSKSRGNVINPNVVVEEYGADTLRLYEMSMWAFTDPAPWNTDAIIGVRRFLDKAHISYMDKKNISKDDMKSMKLLHKTVKKVTEDISEYKFNTAISALQILLNDGVPTDEEFATEWKEKFSILLHPFAPHMAEELWAISGNNGSIYDQKWPSYDEWMLVDDEVTIAVQVNGKLRGTLTCFNGVAQEEVSALAHADENIEKWIVGKILVKEIFIPNKMLSIVVKDV